jgi:hypothetical protein
MSYSNGTYKVNDIPEEFFVMGIKEVNFMEKDSGWYIERVKSYKDVIDREHWKDYGFNYKEENN